MDEGMRVKEGENTMGNYTREEVLQMAEDEGCRIHSFSVYRYVRYFEKILRLQLGSSPGHWIMNM